MLSWVSRIWLAMKKSCGKVRSQDLFPCMEAGEREENLLVKFILSRKGFDSGSGGSPSPILPDGTMLSLPIPEQDSHGKQYDTGRRFCQLNLPACFSRAEFCHLDPDIRPELYREIPKHWRPLFGQCGAAQAHLHRKKVGPNDIFLFFGLFQEVDENFRYRGYPFHAVWGYFQIGEVLSPPDPGDSWHPHTRESYKNSVGNTVYVAKKSLDGDERIPGYGTFVYNSASRPLLTLSLDGKPPVTHWSYSAVPWVEPETGESHMSYHGNRARCRNGYFLAVSRGQEFVLDEEGSAVAGKHFRNLLKYRKTSTIPGRI